MKPQDILTTSVTYQIEILYISQEIPSHLENDITEWLKYKAIEVGTGNHEEFYAYSSDFENEPDICFRFKVSLVFC